MPVTTRSMLGKGEENPGERESVPPAISFVIPHGAESRIAKSKSVRTSKSQQKLIIEARERLARAKLEEARAATVLAEAEMARISAEGSEEEFELIPDKTREVQGWLDSQPERPETPCAATQPQAIDVSALATALTQTVRTTTQRPPKFIQELPQFNGNSGEWLSFKASYRYTRDYFNKIENLMRLKKSLRGIAKEAAQSLFIAEMDPDEVMKHLEMRFGRADALVISEVEKMKGLPKLTDNPRDICIFSSRVSNIVAVVKSLNKIHYLYNPETVRATVDKMTSAMRYRWYDFAVGKEDVPDLITLSSFLSHEAELSSRYAQAEMSKETEHPQKGTQRTYAASSTSKHKKENLPPEASQIKAITNIGDRWEEAKKLNLCFRCLHKRVFRHRCAYQACGTADCKGSHHPLLHTEKPAGTVTAMAAAREANITPPEVVTTTRPHMLERAFLKVLPICIKGPAGTIDTFALLDEGSTVTLIEDKVAQAIGATGPKEPFNIEGIAGAHISASTSMCVSFNLTSKHANKEHEVRARTINQLNLSPQTVDESIIGQCQHLKDIAKDLTYRKGIPTLLIGQDNWHIIVSRSVKSGARGQPVASLTELGWVLHGPCEGVQRVHFVNKVEKQSENRMEELMKAFFDLDNLGVEAKSPQNDKHARALAILEQRSHQLPDGRYETGLLWRDESIVMPNNRDMAVRRLEYIEHKLERCPELNRLYRQQMTHLIKSGYAEEATDPPTPGRTWYLPHFAVTNPSKPKPRIVLDAAARTQGLSLNDCLLTGPDLLQSLPGVLMRFRQREIAVTADIQEMFLRISIRKEDRDALRFLWREDQHRRETPAAEYRMRSVIFGAASSPCTAIFIKNKNAEEHKTRYPEASDAIIRNHYMDDYCQSFDSIDDAIRIASSVDHVHQQAKFYLNKWASNKAEVIAVVAPQQLHQNEEVQINDGQYFEKTLGLVWKPREDVLTFNLNLKRVSSEVLNGTKRPTKREALRTIMSLFDPLGLVTPVIMPAKRLLQDTWRQGVGWDDSLPCELHGAWLEWLGHVQRLRHLSIARCYPRYASAVQLEMHIFVDASSSACVAAVYWRAVTEPATVHLSLAAAKGKVAPLKTTSIPRLELQAAVLGCRLARTVDREHDLKPARRVFWTDSRTVLAWLRNGPRSYKPFVAHRLAELEDETKVCEWRWVPTVLNVADDATRGTPNNFDYNHRWFRGPDFLYHTEESWPREPEPAEQPATGEERVAITRGLPRIVGALPEATRFSSWLRLVRTTGRVLQFIDLCRTRHTTASGRMKRTLRDDSDPAWPTTAAPRQTVAAPRAARRACSVCYISLEAQYVKMAEKLWWRAVQEESFDTDLRRLRRDQPPEQDSPLRALSVILDAEGILRLRSRIDAAADLPEERRSPPVLRGEHMYTRLYIAWIHKRNHHAGTETIVNEIRSHLWVLRLRPITRTIVRSCITCRMLRAKPAIPATGDHPITRLAHHQRPFTYVGLDYFGPYSVTVRRSHEKRYVALFTCLTTRAVHLEVAGSLSTDSAIMALRRMMARRGCPTEIHSDNGTNLRGADAELQKAAFQAVKEEGSIHAITWRYIPPGAPFMGGAWERLVQSVKRAMAATLKERYPTEEVLVTLLLEAEYTINNRPLTPVSVSPDDPEALTPLHFILGGPARVPLPGSFSDRDFKAKQRWRHTQRLADIFWARWIREYAPLLQCRREPRGQGDQPHPGDVVLLVDETTPRNAWIRGRIIKTYPGRDGAVRVVDVDTKMGVRRRATRKIVVLTKEKLEHVSAAGECARR